jgi:dihydrolipoamide dehydrogenase
MLDSTEHFHKAREQFAEQGIEIAGLKVNLGQMIKRKNEVVRQTCDGVSFLMKKNKIDVYHGSGSFKTNHVLSITPASGKAQELEAENMIIATGSKPSTLPFISIDKKRVITSTEALELKEVPGHMIIIGGGVIGVEIGSVYARLGAKITVVEFLDSIIPTMDRTLGKELQKSLKKLGFEIYLKHKVTSVTVKGKSVVVSAENEGGGKAEWSGDYCLVSIGRKPYTTGLGLEKAGIKTDTAGRIDVDRNLQTNIPNIYAIGDVVRGAMLAHKAADEGILVAERLAGHKSHINYLTIPSVVYTWPEVASVGYTEEELKNKGRNYKSGSFPFKALGRARASMDLEGLVKILSDRATDEILGIHIIGPRAADMIAEAVVAMEFRASAEDIARISHAHPTFTEAIREASLSATGNRAIHL